MNIPEGWKLVPVEPTQAMVEAAFDALPNSPFEGRIRTHYRAMLAAAPTPPAQKDDEALEVLRRVVKAIDDRKSRAGIVKWKHAHDQYMAAMKDARALLTKRGAE